MMPVRRLAVGVARLNTHLGANRCDGKRCVRGDLDQMNSVYYYDEQGNVVETDLASRFGVPNVSGVIWIEYDYEEVNRVVSPQELANESEQSLAVRLITSEVGADRLVTNRNGLLENLGICWTVENRLNEEVYRPRLQPQMPCGGDGGSGTSISAATSSCQFAGWLRSTDGRPYLVVWSDVPGGGVLLLDPEDPAGDQVLIPYETLAAQIPRIKGLKPGPWQP